MTLTASVEEATNINKKLPKELLLRWVKSNTVEDMHIGLFTMCAVDINRSFMHEMTRF